LHQVYINYKFNDASYICIYSIYTYGTWHISENVISFLDNLLAMID